MKILENWHWFFSLERQHHHLPLAHRNTREQRNKVSVQKASKKSVQEPSTELVSWQFQLMHLYQFIYLFLFYFFP